VDPDLPSSPTPGASVPLEDALRQLGVLATLAVDELAGPNVVTRLAQVQEAMRDVNLAILRLLGRPGRFE
jgi:hypothetical protein